MEHNNGVKTWTAGLWILWWVKWGLSERQAACLEGLPGLVKGSYDSAGEETLRVCMEGPDGSVEFKDSEAS